MASIKRFVLKLVLIKSSQSRDKINRILLKLCWKGTVFSCSGSGVGPYEGSNGGTEERHRTTEHEERGRPQRLGEGKVFWLRGNGSHRLRTSRDMVAGRLQRRSLIDTCICIWDRRRRGSGRLPGPNRWLWVVLQQGVEMSIGGSATEVGMNHAGDWD